MKTHNYEHWIETYLGHPIDPLNPEPKRICVQDIIHALSNQCRFSGHTRSFYSVGQHSVLVSILLQQWGMNIRTQVRGLFHDASEAYLVDMPTPIKRQMPTYRQAEAPLQEMIEKTLFWDFIPATQEEIESIKQADLALLATEARDLMRDPKDWKVLQGVAPMPERILPLLPPQAKEYFQFRYEDLVRHFAVRECRK